MGYLSSSSSRLVVVPQPILFVVRTLRVDALVQSQDHIRALSSAWKSTLRHVGSASIVIHSKEEGEEEGRPRATESIGSEGETAECIFSAQAK